MKSRVFAACTIATVVASFAACSPAQDTLPPPPPPPVTSAMPVAVVDAGVAPPDDHADEVAIFTAEKDFVALIARLWPETATFYGLHDRDGELDPREGHAWDAAVDEEEKFEKDLEQKFASPKARRALRTDLEIMEHFLRVDVRRKRVERPLERDPSIYASPMNAIYLQTAREYAPAKDRAAKVLERLEKIPAMLEVGKKNLQNPPKIWTQVGIEQADAAKGFFDEQRTFLLGALPDQKARIDTDVKAAEKAYADYSAFLRKDVTPRSNGNFAAGKELFEFLLHEDYFLKDNSDQVYDLGKRVFDATDAEMRALAKKIDPTAKDWSEVTKKVKGHHPAAADLLTAYRSEVARARKFLADKDAVPFPEGDDLSVVDTPIFQRSTITAAYDQPAPFDLSVTKGLFFVTPVDTTLSKAKQEESLRENDHGDIVDTAVHEAYPGHHLQLSFARQNPSLARKATGPDIFAEGWGLYSEELMNELGYYTDEERMMQLEWTLVRAARVMIDVGLHTRGMTYEDAVKLLTDQVHLERPLAVSEAKRYTMTPTQPLSYLTGREAIFRMRERYKQREGSAYTLKRFHAELLSHGTIAPGLLEEEIFEK